MARDLPRTLIAASAVVVAVCVAILTARIMISGLPLTPTPTFEKSDFTSQVMRILRDRGALSELVSASCPEGTVDLDVTFRCTVEDGTTSKTVPVKVVDADTGEIEVGDLEG